MQTNRVNGFGRVALAVAVSALALAACSKEAPAEGEEAAAPAAGATAPAAAAPAAAPAAIAVAADNTDTLKGEKLASFTGDAATAATDFLTCKTCHAIEAGVSKIGPSLNKVVGRKAGTAAGFSYTPANANSGITWTPEKLFQYLEGPQRVMPGTKMAYAGMSDPQKRANVIAYLQTN